MGIQFHVREGVLSRKKESPFQPARKAFHILRSLKKLFGQADMVETAGYAPSKPYRALQKCSPGDNCFTAELKGNNERLELN